MSAPACRYCDEPVLPGEAAAGLVNIQDLHRECAVRMLMGSAAHQLGECPCNGGARKDPPGMSVRDAARLALETFEHIEGQR